MKNNPTTKKVSKKRNNLFTRMTLITVLGIFVLLFISMLVTLGLVSFIAQYWTVDKENTVLFGLVALMISLIVGVGLSFAFSAILRKAIIPYLDALQEITDCNFSVRINDRPILANLGIADTINSMAEQLGSVETLREGFVSDFSHEFKTPIVSIAGFATLLKDKNLTEEDRNEYLDVIIDESHRLVELSESVLMLSRLDSQTIVNESFLLDEQLRQCMLLFARPCSAKNINLTADFDALPIVGCKKLMSQIWVNLLSNAVKFTPVNGEITVSATRSDDKLSVTVADTGCGMTEETMSKIFIKFYQGEKSRSTAGNGLGLSVVKKICDLLNIGIQVESKLNKGSKFIITIPVENFKGN